MNSAAQTAQNHPVAATTATAGGLSAAVVWLLGHLGVALSAEDGVFVAAILSTVIAAVGRRGIMGLGRLILHGSRE